MKSSQWLILLISILLSACNSRPEYVIDEDTMTDLLVDVHLSEGLLDVQGRQMNDHPNYGQEVMAAVLLKHGVSRAEYDTSLVWYSQNLKYLIRIYNHVDQELELRSKEWAKLANSHRSVILSVPGDDVDIWALNRSLLMDETRLSQSLLWSIPADSCFHAGDTVKWKFHAHQMPQGQSLVASMAILKSNPTFGTPEYCTGVTSGPITQDSTIVHVLCPEEDVYIKKIVLSLNLLKNSGDSLILKPALVDSVELIRKHRK